MASMIAGAVRRQADQGRGGTHSSPLLRCGPLPPRVVIFAFFHREPASAVGALADALRAVGPAVEKHRGLLHDADVTVGLLLRRLIELVGGIRGAEAGTLAE